jgi:ribonucleotide monophosphatase NagD (HAD superfamily)
MSNNSSVPVGEVAAKLGRFGIAVPEAHVLTSAMAAADLLVDTMPPPGRVLACAGPGVVEAVTAAGYDVVTDGPSTRSSSGSTAPSTSTGCSAPPTQVRAGARFVATNLDATYPIPGGLLPGAGSIVRRRRHRVGPHTRGGGQAGAPAAAMVRHRLGDRGVMVGDRPTTDGALADQLGWPFALVLSGVASRTPGPGEEPVPDPPPPFVGDDFLALVPSLVAALVPA